MEQTGFPPLRMDSFEHQSEGSPLVDDELEEDISTENDAPLNSAQVWMSSPDLRRRSQIIDETDLHFDRRPVWVPDSKAKDCKRCSEEFTLFLRRHHCRFCGDIYCRNCCFVRASYPSWFDYASPQLVCENCIPAFFRLRRHSAVNDLKEKRELFLSQPNLPSSDAARNTIQRKRVLSHFPTSAVHLKEEGLNVTSITSLVAGSENPQMIGTSYITSGTILLATPFRIIDPLLQFIFWGVGMGDETSKFDRKTMESLSKTKFRGFMDPVAKVEQMFIPVKKKIPRYPSPNEYPEPVILNGEKTHDMPILVYTPNRKIDGPQMLPITLLFHGGGFCIGSVHDQIYEGIARTIANRVGTIVVAVEYRLAPEYKFPTCLEDCYAALKWVHSKAKTVFGGDPDNIAVIGDSAGGSLSAVLSILSRDRMGPPIKHQILVYPALTDPTKDDLESHVKYQNGPVITRNIIKWFYKQLVNDMDDLKHYLAQPLLMGDYSGLPPATIINALHDPLFDHGAIYAKLLQNCGVPTTHSIYKKSCHGFFGSQIGEANEAMAEVCADLMDAFGLIPINGKVMC